MSGDDSLKQSEASTADAPRPKRARRAISDPLSQSFPALEAEWDYERNGDLTPEGISSGSSRKVWWICSTCGFGWEAIVNNRAKRGSGCPACSGRVVREGYNDIATLYPELMLDWDWESNGDLDPRQLMRTNNVRIRWKCHECGNRWMSSLVTRTLHDSGCSVCRTRERAEKGNLLAIRYPDIASEWNFARNAGVDIMTVAQYSDMNVWWRCGTCGNEYQTRVRNRTNGKTGCPKCAAERFARRAKKSFVEQGLPVRIGVTYDAETDNVFSGLGRCGLIRVYELEGAWDPACMGLKGEDLVRADAAPAFRHAADLDTSGLKREGITRALATEHITHFITGELGGNAMLSLATTGTLCFYDVEGIAEECVRNLLTGKLAGKRLDRAKAQRL